MLVRSSRNASVRGAKDPRSVSSGLSVISLSKPMLASTGASVTSAMWSCELTVRSSRSRAIAVPSPTSRPMMPATARLSVVCGATWTGLKVAASVTVALICAFFPRRRGSRPR